MTIDQVRSLCLSLSQTEESMPFGEEVLVFKVLGKMFCTLRLSIDLSINVKCEPERALFLREQYDGVSPGYHMSKKHWNTIDLSSGIRQEQISQWIQESYELVVKSLPKSKRGTLEQL